MQYHLILSPKYFGSQFVGVILSDRGRTVAYLGRVWVTYLTNKLELHAVQLDWGKIGVWKTKSNDWAHEIIINSLTLCSCHRNMYFLFIFFVSTFFTKFLPQTSFLFLWIPLTEDSTREESNPVPIQCIAVSVE